VYTNLGIPERRFWRTRPDWVHHLAVARFVDVYGCMSRYAAGFLQTDFGRTAALTPGGVRLDRFRPAARRDAAPTLLYSGTFADPRKGVATLLDAVAILARSEPGLQVWLSGPGDPAPYLAAAPAAARERVRVLTVGQPQDTDVYANAWATVLPSTNETFGIVLVESMAAGTPVVGTTHAALPELVTPAVGALAEPGDAASLADACARALALAREPDIVDRCRHAAAPYDWETGLAPHLERLYAGDGSTEP
jgi:phosphatidylinositol alpha-mannosyltransferase